MILVSDKSGNDVVTNFGIKDTLRATSGVMSYYKSGSDYIVEIESDDSSATVKLKNAAKNYSIVKKNSTITLKSKSSSSQMPSDDYWFLEDNSIKEDALSEIVSTDNAVDLSTDFESDLLKRATNDLLTASARKRQRK